MKTFLATIGALVAGVLIGAAQPRGELLRLRGDLADMKKETAKCRRASAAAGIREILRADAPRADEVPPPQSPEPPGDGVHIQLGDGTAANEPVGNSGAEESLDAALLALDARRAQARAALAEEADLEEGQLAAVDAAVEKMNARITAEVERFVSQTMADGELDRRETMDFAAEALDIVIEADDGIRGAIPAEVYAALDDSAVDPFSYLSGDALRALMRLEGMAEAE
jgi:hypothetical protein